MKKRKSPDRRARGLKPMDGTIDGYRLVSRFGSALRRAFGAGPIETVALVVASAAKSLLYSERARKRAHRQALNLRGGSPAGHWIRDTEGKVTMRLDRGANRRTRRMKLQSPHRQARTQRFVANHGSGRKVVSALESSKQPEVRSEREGWKQKVRGAVSRIWNRGKGAR